MDEATEEKALHGVLASIERETNKLELVAGRLLGQNPPPPDTDPTPADVNILRDLQEAAGRLQTVADQLAEVV